MPRGLGNSHLENNGHHEELLINSNPLSCGDVCLVDSQIVWIIGTFGVIAPSSSGGGGEGSWWARPIIHGYRYSGGWAGGVGMEQGWMVTLDVAQALSMGHCHGLSPHTPSQHQGPVLCPGWHPTLTGTQHLAWSCCRPGQSNLFH